MSKNKSSKPKIADPATPTPPMRNNADALEYFRTEKQKQGFLSTFLSDKNNNLDPASQMRLSDLLKGTTQSLADTQVTNPLTANQPATTKKKKTTELNNGGI